ncbi:FAD-dependent oxidoreductase [Granulicella sp. S156]|uniref:FAD-dependent oxidoreductase n=1 Tax=Granulicella sp. S156 TaxID=1747224 RepID=UPI00131B0EDC|nr:FAD-dependent oxidoreductase [Granulicella sp. S156]
MQRYCLIFLLLFSIVPISTAQGGKRNYDVVIAGAGTGGTAAALSAARMGAHVALLEETDWIGGQASAAAVSTMDEGSSPIPPSGIYREFLVRMEAYYAARSKSVSTCYWGEKSHCYEPSAIRKILQGMIDEINAGAYGKGHIDLILEDRVVKVLSEGDVVQGIVTAKGMTLHSKILIDATEYGDVLPLTPARYRRGHFVSPSSESSCIQDITYPIIIKRYTDGVPDELKMKHQPPEYEKWLPKLRSQWQAHGNSVNRTLPIDFGEHNAYRGLPDSSNPESYTSAEHNRITRTGVNWFNDYPATTDIYDRAKRNETVCGAKLKTLANLYYLQHELGEVNWSIANDEGYDSKFNREQNSCPNIPSEFKAIERNFPVMPYVRESQRLVGEHTLTSGELRRETQGGMSVVGFPDSIAVGDYADDLHGCNAPANFESELEHVTDRPPGFRSGPFEIPLGSLIPEKVDGLLAAEKNISQSRMANGATRLQPSTMLTGQAAGVLAAMAVSDNVSPRKVPVAEVQIALLKSGVVLSRAHMSDMAAGTVPWQAAQMAYVRNWFPLTDVGFKPQEPLDRGQVAVLLEHAFHLNESSDVPENETDHTFFDKSSYSDVPVYSPISPSVEAWRRTETLPACNGSATLFCPNDGIDVNIFMDAVAKLEEKQRPGPSKNISLLHRGVVDASDAPLTRGTAAIILYNSMRKN